MKLKNRCRIQLKKLYRRGEKRLLRSALKLWVGKALDLLVDIEGERLV